MSEMTQLDYYVGVDVGGSHLTCGFVEAASFDLLENSLVRRDLDTHAEVPSVIAAFEHAIRDCASRIGLECVKGIGLAFPGPFDYANGICLIPPALGKYEHCHGLDFKKAFRRVLAYEGPIGFLNDATCFGIGECLKGGGRGSRRTLVITLGTGFGTTFLANGHPVTSGDEVPPDGQLWHVPYGDSMADDTFSTRGLRQAWAKLSGQDVAGVKEIAHAALRGEPLARELFTAFGRKMGEFLAPWLVRFSADTVVIGGNIARDLMLFGPALKDALKAAGGPPVIIKPSELGESAQMIGAARALTF